MHLVFTVSHSSHNACSQPNSPCDLGLRVATARDIRFHRVMAWRGNNARR